METKPVYENQLPGGYWNMKIELKRLTEVKKPELINLMNHPMVRRQMPLLKESFNESACNKFIAAKELLWMDYGYGPWAFFIEGHFAGWGGLQPEDGEADLALVLHPDYWGMGKTIYQHIIKRAFYEMNLESVTILFPPTRIHINGLLKLGFKKESEVMLGRQLFIKYRLKRPSNE
ncbi:MAG TPA: GNAT family N-acetyltransferase [Eudoraea sp.]|nr:GNAT family N-acetyltransferase [Eudoraea sp.]